MQNKEIRMDVHEKPSWKQWILLSMQHLFAMFGATILVPILTGLQPAIALLASGIGTLAYLLVTKGQIPAYLGSSFAFITPLIVVGQGGTNIGEAMFGCLLVGITFGVVSLLIYKIGIGWLERLLPPVVIGSVIIVIGLSLAPTAIDMAMNETVTQPIPTTSAEWQALGGSVQEIDEAAKIVTVKQYSLRAIMVALATLGIAVLANMFLRGFLAIIPVLLGIVGGTIIAYFFGMVDLSAVKEAPWFALPTWTAPEVSWRAAWIIVPATLVVIAEHIGHLAVTSNILGRDLAKKPGLHRSLLGDGIATTISSLLGGPPATTYGENIGVMAITRIFSVWVMGGAAMFAILFSFIGKLSALIQSIPSPVMGGVSILLFGIIASSGLRMLIEHQVNLNLNRNLVIASVILVIGIGGAVLKLTSVNLELSGMALATLVGILLHLILPDASANNETEVVDRPATDLA